MLSAVSRMELESRITHITWRELIDRARHEPAAAARDTYQELARSIGSDSNPGYDEIGAVAAIVLIQAEPGLFVEFLDQLFLHQGD